MKTPALETNVRDPEFGAKLDALASVIGHLHPLKKFENVAIGQALGIDKARTTNLRQGTVPVRPAYLARLVNHFELGGVLDPSAFGLPLDEFKKHMKDHRIGIHGGGRGARARQKLFDLANPSDPMGGRCWIDIWNVRLTRRAGGMGLPPEEREGPPQFMERDEVRMKVTCPAPGNLIVLDDQLNIEITCLMPSVFAPMVKIRDKSIVLPTSVENGTTAFHIARPEGLHRLYAIWSAEALDMKLLGVRSENDEPTVIDEEALSRFTDVFAIAYQRDQNSMAVGAADYRVI